MQKRFLRDKPALVVLLGGLTGCYSGWNAELSDNTGQDPGSGNSGDSADVGDSGSDGDPSDTDDAPESACGEPGDLINIGESTLQRLSRLEYNQTVRDLVGDTSNPADILPDDDRVGSFASNSITHVPEHTVALYATLAESVAEHAVGDIGSLVPCDPADGLACADSFLIEFGRRAFRRPLSDVEIGRLLDVFELGAEEGFSSGIQLMLEAMFQSPHFLYRVEEGLPSGTEGVVELTPYELASRLSFFAWKTTPDDELLDAAESGQLATSQGLREQATRLLEDERALLAVEAFHEQWLGLDGPHGLEVASKDPELFPQFTTDLKEAMLAEQHAFVRHVFLEEGAALDTLLTARFTFVNEDLAALYDIEGVTGQEMVRVELDPAERIGILTQAGILASRAGPSDTSTTLRGKLIRDELLCDTMPPPPADVNEELDEREPGETKKEQMELVMGDPYCRSCHVLMDPLGYGLENYDAIGSFRTMDGEFAVDATGEVFSDKDDVAGPYDGAIELVERLAASDTVARCMTRQWGRFALGRDVRNDETECVLESAYEAFDESNRDLRELMIELVMLDSFRYRRMPAED